jgi:uncharacterized protein YdeI (YjbR/CyaY-like superfamily)
MAKIDAPPVMSFATRAAWDKWLSRQKADSPGVWLKIAKAGRQTKSISYPEALDSALCYGWIDGLKRGLDDEWWLQRFTPRTSRSKWSQINCGKAEALIASGAMKPAGLAQVEAAKADGRWAMAYAGQATVTVPDDLALALKANKAAGRAFEGIDRVNRYAILHRIHDAKRPETRAARIAKFVAMLARGELIHQSGRAKA